MCNNVDDHTIDHFVCDGVWGHEEELRGTYRICENINDCQSSSPSNLVGSCALQSYRCSFNAGLDGLLKKRRNLSASGGVHRASIYHDCCSSTCGRVHHANTSRVMRVNSTCRIRYASTCGVVYPASTGCSIRGTSTSRGRGASTSRVHCASTSVHHASACRIATPALVFEYIATAPAWSYMAPAPVVCAAPV